MYKMSHSQKKDINWMGSLMDGKMDSEIDGQMDGWMID